MGSILRYPFSLWQKAMEHHFRMQESCGTILMLHEVYAEDETPEDFRNAISRKHFIELMEHLSRTKRFVRLDGYQAVLDMSKNDVALTFDDIYENAYRNAFPVLKERDIPYTVFIASGLLGRPHYITREELAVLQSERLCTVGAHSVSHGLARFGSHPRRSV